MPGFCRITPISIHALLAESDLGNVVAGSRMSNFYPRSPCGERRWLRCWQLAARDISIHALLAESDAGTVQADYGDNISIHALLAESDRSHYRSSGTFERFLSTLSLRRATALGLSGWLRTLISIHALLAESDNTRCREIFGHYEFLSTLSLRRATATTSDQGASNQFLSTLSLRRATMIHPRSCNAKPNFYPRSPCGERRCKVSCSR